MVSKMKKIDGSTGKETKVYLTPELTRVRPLWNHPRNVGVAQAILPVRFSDKCKPLLEPVWDLGYAAGEGFRKHGDFCEVTFAEAIS
jgi:hypothetical protein